MDTDNKLLVVWDDVKKLVDDVELDVTKAAAGNNAANLRARRGLRELKKRVAELTKLSLTFGNELKEKNKKAKKS